MGRSRFSRRNRLLEDSSSQNGALAGNFTMLGQGEPTLYTDLNVNINNLDIGGDGGGGGGGGSVVPPPVPVQPPTDQPLGMPAYQGQPNVFWQQVSAPAAGNNWSYVHKNYDFPVFVRRINFILIASAVATSRVCLITARDTGGQRIMIWYPTTAHAANIVAYYQFADNQALATVVVSAAFGGPPTQPSVRLAFLPTVILEKNFSIGTEFNDGIVGNSPEVGDVFSGIGLLLERADR